jgi:hypothetical protein
VGRAIAQAASRCFYTAAASVRARVWSCGICGGQSGAGVRFFRVLRFPQPIFIPPVTGRSTKWTQPHPTKDNNKKVTRKIFKYCRKKNGIKYIMRSSTNFILSPLFSRQLNTGENRRGYR